MHAIVLQDWTTIRGGSGVTLTQSEQDWLDLEPYQDVVFWLQVIEQSGGPTMSYQTSPTKDDSLFQSMASTGSLVATLSPVITQVYMLSANVPLARYVRWQLTGTPAWDATFRVVVAANQEGMGT